MILEKSQKVDVKTMLAHILKDLEDYQCINKKPQESEQ